MTNPDNVGGLRLFDSQWVNIVNHDNCYRDYTKEEAVAKAVKLTESAMRENCTHPQDASGDAEDARRYRAQFADGTWFYCLEWVGLDKAALDRDIDAMQAKEAK